MLEFAFRQHGDARLAAGGVELGNFAQRISRKRNTGKRRVDVRAGRLLAPNAFCGKESSRGKRNTLDVNSLRRLFGLGSLRPAWGGLGRAGIQRGGCSVHRPRDTRSVRGVGAWLRIAGPGRAQLFHQGVQFFLLRLDLLLLRFKRLP